jgi:4-amino-4-deoxy-L-arabinose transferase-like glycosyltransferase
MSRNLELWSAVSPRTVEVARPQVARRLVGVDLAALGLIVLLGLGVRLIGLTGYGIWDDEAYHIALVKLPTVAAMLDAVLSNPPSDPLYVLLLRGWVSLFGHGDAQVRLLSVIFSVATLPATYWLGRAMVGRAAGLLAALLFALSPYAVELGQEAALYSLAALTTTAALAAGLRWRATGRGAALYVALGILAIYSHYVVALILALFAMLGGRGSWDPRNPKSKIRVPSGPPKSDWIVAHTIIFAAWLPWVVALVVHFANTSVPRVTLGHKATWLDVLDALLQYTAGTAARGAQDRALLIPGLLVCAALFALGLAAPGRGRRDLRAVALIAAAIVLPPTVISYVTGLWLFVPHFLLFLFPALMLVLASGALWLLGWGLPGRVLFGVVLALWLWVQLAGLQYYYRNPPHGNDGLRELAAQLRHAAPGDLVLVTPPLLTAALEQYYPGTIHGLPSDFDLRALYLPYDPASWTRQSLDALMAQAPGHAHLWLVYRPEQDAQGALLRAAQGRFHQELSTSYGFATLYRFSVP